MNSELRRSRRITDYLPITVHAVDGVNGNVIAGPFSSRIIDISTGGSCLLMSQVFKDGFHVFHTTREDDSLHLRLTINLPPDLFNLSLIALPIWMDLFRQNEIRAFKLGVEFMVSPDGVQMKKLQRALQKNQKSRGEWWLRHSRTRKKK